ncbi:uncharacterized protein LOC134280633 [Saccostrea cucullata]|uniref:uncharacterized protein LOC134280633 n=1 Tax=Saccostrea cuccullata TaxID=36930 RepID=UPI002ED3111D
MDHIPRLSEVLYVGLCGKIGTPTEVAIRRDVMDMEEMIRKPVQMYIGCRYIDSGSYREGFRFDPSDRDTMFWIHSHKMISKLSQSSIYKASKHTIILMEETDTPPGFVRLQLLTQPKDTMIKSALVSLNGTHYLSNLFWKEKYLREFKENKGYQNIDGHGPCLTGYCENIEIDYALCLNSIHWTKITSNWINRSRDYTWPPEFVLTEILKNGFHCVAIGNNILSPYYELEWRLSFSRAEHKLVCTMNHTQFLCYGLLKLFLKEVINHIIREPLLCSYHIKTSMFWIMQLNTTQWCRNNLLNSFWKCFKYLIHCVYHGEFPNFFIPQNNMFSNKVIGSTRCCLLEQLNQYYRMGVSCLLLSPTLRSILDPALRTLSFVVHFVEGHVNSVLEIDRNANIEIFSLSFSISSYQQIVTQLKSVERLLQFSFSPYQTLTLQYCTPLTLIDIVFITAQSSSCICHKETFALERISCNILKLAGRIGCVSDLLYLALYYYRIEWLSVLSYYRLGNQSLYQQSLSDFKTLLLYDDWRYIPTHQRDLAWQILGICQHVVGDLYGALYSYQESLKQEPCHQIQKATETRISCVERQLQ